MKLLLRVTLVAALAPLSLGALAKPPPPQSPLVGALAACQAIADNVQRLACFDKAAGALVTAAGQGDVSVVDRAQLRTARKALFGFTMPKLPFFSGDDSASDVSDTLETTIKSASGIGYGKFRIVVAEGDAVWETTETFATLRDPKVGQKITIKRGPLGSYMIKINNQRAVKGRRVG
jgi:hypothetical protein